MIVPDAFAEQIKLHIIALRLIRLPRSQCCANLDKHRCY
jgi:hypothetical protein